MPRAVGNHPGSPILLQLETMDKVKGSSTHGKGFDDDYIDTREDLRVVS